MRKAIIIGAGITGPVTAMALRQAGLDATIYEAYDRSADGVGAFLTVAVNGLAALRLIAVDARDFGGFDTPVLAMQNSAGRPLGTFAIGRPDNGLVSQSIRRSDLYIGLRDEAVRRGIAIEYGKKLLDATTGADGRVVATFADGTRAKGDLLIGGDGLNSRTRALLNPDGRPPRYTGLLNTGGFAHGIDVATQPGVFTMTFGRRAFFAYVKRGPGDVWWFANVPRAAEASRDALAELASRWRTELQRLFADDHTPALQLIAHTDDILTPWNTCDLPTVARWHSASIVLLGDAAHAISPTSGQGASLAIEDGVVLAKCLRDQPDTGAALAAFEALRRRRVEKLITRAKRTSDQKIPGRVSGLIRDRIVIPLVARQAARSTSDWVHDYRINWEAPVTT
ncbi:FAD-dependent monooxygenase [Actinopolymorpha sp. B17G11]|uniref:FAD-dependent monooxygenase n=1 Tax=Actinopolymorpha sp. B17G11 TaxID=3160861 RepID=UPI0032E41B45